MAASTAPRAVGESETSSTANASATGAIVDPAMLMKLERKYHRKLRTRIGANAAVSPAMADKLPNGWDTAAGG